VALTTFVHKLGHGRPHLTSMDHLRKTATSQSAQDPLPPLNRMFSNQSQVGQVKKSRGAALDGHYELLVEHPFDSTIKRMSVAYKFIPSDESREKEHVVAYMKGAVVSRVQRRQMSGFDCEQERVIEGCPFVGMDCETKLDESHRSNIMNTVESLAAEGLRVLSLSGKYMDASQAEEIRKMPRDQLERDFGLLGLVGILSVFQTCVYKQV
jgi:Na+-exporting ATPase